MYNKCTLSVIEVKEGTSVLFRVRLVQSRNISVRWAKYKSKSCTCLIKIQKSIYSLQFPFISIFFVLPIHHFPIKYMTDLSKIYCFYRLILKIDIFNNLPLFCK